MGDSRFRAAWSNIAFRNRGVSPHWCVSSTGTMMCCATLCCWFGSCTAVRCTKFSFSSSSQGCLSGVSFFCSSADLNPLKYLHHLCALVFLVAGLGQSQVHFFIYTGGLLEGSNFFLGGWVTAAFFSRTNDWFRQEDSPGCFLFVFFAHSYSASRNLLHPEDPEEA